MDTDVAALERGRARAAELSLAGRVEFAAGEAAEWRGVADRVICVGAAHAWGGTAAALHALAEVVPAEGRLLYGDGCWECPPTPAAEILFGAETLPLGEVVRLAVSAGWRVLHLDVADQREWDDFESTWRAGSERWLRTHPGDAAAASVRGELDRRLAEYLTVYRGVLGFTYLVLGR